MAALAQAIRGQIETDRAGDLRWQCLHKPCVVSARGCLTMHALACSALHKHGADGMQVSYSGPYGGVSRRLVVGRTFASRLFLPPFLRAAR